MDEISTFYITVKRIKSKQRNLNKTKNFINHNEKEIENHTRGKEEKRNIHMQ